MTLASNTSVLVSAPELQRFAAALLEAAGVSADIAAEWAKALVWSNLRGVDSHGVLRIPRYIELLGKKAINSAPVMRLEKKARRHRRARGGPGARSGRDVAGNEGSHRLRPRGPYRLVRGPQYHACRRDRIFCPAGGGSRNGGDRHDRVRSDDGLPRRPRRRRIDQSDCDRISRRQQAAVPDRHVDRDSRHGQSAQCP